jgi:bisphosphoglycerate-dependent phosphoglycerate mutase
MRKQTNKQTNTKQTQNKHKTNTENKMRKKCERCGNIADLFKHEFIDEFGNKRVMWICWDYDFEIANGKGDYDDDEWEIQEEREEEDYEYDPIYYPLPKWMSELKKKGAKP